jgi:hypothetical protein
MSREFYAVYAELIETNGIGASAPVDGRRRVVPAPGG